MDLALQLPTNSNTRALGKMTNIMVYVRKILKIKPFYLGVRKRFTNTGGLDSSNCSEIRESECKNGLWHGKATTIC